MAASTLIFLIAIFVTGRPGLGFRSFHTENISDMQVDETGKVFVSAGRQLYQLNDNLEVELMRNLTSDSVNISLSSDGRWLVVCMTDLSCEVYNAAIISAPVTRKSDVIRSAKNVALFSADNSFYVGSISIDNVGAQQQITLGQFEFDQDGNPKSNNYVITLQNFERNLYSGFIKGNNAYYFAVDNNPTRIRDIRVMRVCHNSDFNALYELSLRCGGRTPSSDTRISGLSVVNKFAGIAGPTVVLSRNRPSPSSQNYVCLYSLQRIDTIMQMKYNSCAAAIAGDREQIELAWRTLATFCSEFQPSQNVCHFTTIPLALDDIENLEYNGQVQIDLGQNFITASVAIFVEPLSFIFVAFTSVDGSSFITGFEITSCSQTLMESNDFDRRPIASPVRRLLWHSGLDFIYGITQTSVIKIPIADCSSHHNCTSCLESGNPLCGWCLLENKCSKNVECQNFNVRWIQANKTSTKECLTITVIPLNYVMDNPQAITLLLSRTLPNLLEDETYLCHLASNRSTFTVEAEGSETTYTCNISRRISEYQQLVTVVFISLASSSLAIPFSTSISPFTIYQCNYSPNCAQCVQTNNVCGWCVYNKLCTGTSASCINGLEGYLQVNSSMNEDYTYVCPLLDQPAFGNYLQPVQVRKKIELITRNLPPPISGFSYVCRLNSTDLPAIYNNQSSLTCSVGVGQLTLDTDASHESVSATVQWIGNYHGGFIIHQIGSRFPVNVTLYNCAVASYCSFCLSYKVSEGFECGWCDRPSGVTDSCTYIGACEATLITEGSGCPAPIITDFNPKSGPIEGGTTITITGRDLGVTFDDFTSNNIVIGEDPCIPNENNFIPGKQIDCTTLRGSSAGINFISLTLPSGIAMSNTGFRIAIPEIRKVDPLVGPLAGGTELTVWGSNLDIGNKVNTRLHLSNGTDCLISQIGIQEESITCTTLRFTSTDIPMKELIILFIDFAVISNVSVLFTYVPNPEFSCVTPSMTIIAGGIRLIFNGTNLDAVQQPVLEVNDQDYLDVVNVTECKAMNFSTIVCVTPPLHRIPSDDRDGLNYTILMDNAPGPDLTLKSLQITVLPNPENFSLITTNIAQLINGSIQISGDNLNSVSANEICVTIGGAACVITAVHTNRGLLFCTPPPEPIDGITRAIVTVSIGLYLKHTLTDSFSYDNKRASTVLTLLYAVLFPLLAIIAVVTLLLFLALKIHKRVKRKQFAIDSRLPLSSVPLTSQSLQLDSKKPVEWFRSQVFKKLIIPNKQLQMLNKTIGQGEFGIVHAAHLVKRPGHRDRLTVAVKTLKCLHTDSDLEKVIAEVNKMKKMHHPNVMPLIGVCLNNSRGLSIVMPFMANGSLLDYLRKERANLHLKSNSDLSAVMSAKKLLVRMCHQIAKGMEYLTSQKFVHRDLAARNCMLDSLGNVRVGDFGLAEDIYMKGYFRQGKYDVVKLPFKWMAPESLRDGLFSEKSDVWSFGITCWEVFSGGRIPYSAVDAISILTLHEKGTRLEKPSNAACAHEDFSMIMKCWTLEPEDRPTFKELSSDIDELLQTAAGYLELNMVLLPPKDEENSIDSDSDYEITENPFKEELQSITIANPEAIDLEQQQQAAGNAKSISEDSGALSIKDIREISTCETDCGGEDYRETTFTMMRNTSYSDTNNHFKDIM